MEELWVEERGKFLVVELDEIEYNVLKDKVNEVANVWQNVEPEQVARMWAIIKSVEATERHIKMSWEKFKREYGRILKLIGPEMMISYMIDNAGRRLLEPKELYASIIDDMKSNSDFLIDKIKPYNIVYDKID